MVSLYMIILQKKNRLANCLEHSDFLSSKMTDISFFIVGTENSSFAGV